MIDDYSDEERAPGYQCVACEARVKEGQEFCRACRAEGKAGDDGQCRCDSGYGKFPGGDPRDFCPDPEASTPGERAKHSRACDEWRRGEFRPLSEGKPLDVCAGRIVCLGGFGLGVYTARCRKHGGAL